MNDIVGIHPYADKFPMLPEGELAELAESIRANGLRNPIVITPEGLVLDGRNRLAACELVDVEPATVVYDGDDLAEYVIDCNVTRRNMMVGARAMSMALVLEADGRRVDGRWDYGKVRESFATKNSTGVAISKAGTVLDFKPDLAESVVNEAISLDDAYQQAKAIKDSAERDKILAREKAKRVKAEAAAEAEFNAQVIADLTQVGAQKYLDLIEDDTLTPKAAWSAYREDTRKERQAVEDARRILKDRFTGIGKAVSTFSAWGGYDDNFPLMEGYEPSLAPGVADYFELEHLRAARRLIDRLITWKESD